MKKPKPTEQAMSEGVKSCAWVLWVSGWAQEAVYTQTYRNETESHGSVFLEKHNDDLYNHQN